MHKFFIIVCIIVFIIVYSQTPLEERPNADVVEYNHWLMTSYYRLTTVIDVESNVL